MSADTSAGTSASFSSRPVYIAGVAETALGEVFDQTEMSMVALAAREALAERVEAGGTWTGCS